MSTHEQKELSTNEQKDLLNTDSDAVLLVKDSVCIFNVANLYYLKQIAKSGVQGLNYFD